MVMKRLLVPIVVVASLLAAVPSSVFAEPAQIEEIIKLLHEAKASAEPLPLLEPVHAFFALQSRGATQAGGVPSRGDVGHDLGGVLAGSRVRPAASMARSLRPGGTT